MLSEFSTRYQLLKKDQKTLILRLGAGTKYEELVKKIFLKFFFRINTPNLGQILKLFYIIIDIDECKQSKDSVCHFNEKCENTIGSYKCTLVLICDKGYELNSDKTECIGRLKKLIY